MKFLAVLLVVGVFIAHDGANWLSGKFSPAATFYMLQGTWSAILSGCLLVLVAAAHSSLWKNLIIGALWVSIIEGLQVTFFRLLVADIHKVPAGMNLGDYVTGLPVGATMTSLEVFIIAAMVGRHYWNE